MKYMLMMHAPRGDLDLPQEALGAEHRDRHLAVVLEVLGEIDRGHAARAEFALQAIAVRQRGGEAIERISHADSLRRWPFPTIEPQVRAAKCLPRARSPQRQQCFELDELLKILGPPHRLLGSDQCLQPQGLKLDASDRDWF